MTRERIRVLVTGLLFLVVGISSVGLYFVGEANQERCLDERCDAGDPFMWAGFLGMALLIVGLLFLGAAAFRHWGF